MSCKVELVRCDFMVGDKFSDSFLITVFKFFFFLILIFKYKQMIDIEIVVNNFKKYGVQIPIDFDFVHSVDIKTERNLTNEQIKSILKIAIRELDYAYCSAPNCDSIQVRSDQREADKVALRKMGVSLIGYSDAYSNYGNLKFP